MFEYYINLKEKRKQVLQPNGIITNINCVREQTSQDKENSRMIEFLN